MFRQIYEASIAVFLLQGVLLLPLLIVVGTAWRRQGARLNAVGAALERDRVRRDRTLKSLLKALPKLVPLNCPSCGGALSLDVESTTCARCRATFPPPADYAATASLRRRLKRLTDAALFHWYLARLLTSTPLHLLFLVMVIGEPAIFGIVLIGAATYSDTWLDRLFTALGENTAFAAMLLCFGGFIIWMVAFIMLASLSRDLRRTLPAFPVGGSRSHPETEFSTCRSCGGGIHYDRRAFAALCGYCSVENCRADHARREHAVAEGERASTRATLFGAMKVIEDFTGMFFVVMAILTGGFGLLVIWTAARG